MTRLTRSFFEAMYQDNPDPWNFANSEYEARKYAATLDALPLQSYGSGLEVGCSIGVLTAALAKRCQTLLAIDIVDAPLEQARARNVHNPNVEFQRADFPASLPAGLLAQKFDLILLSEVLYYLDAESVRDSAQRTLDLARANADVLLVHWLGPTPDYPLTGDEAADVFIAAVRPQARLVRQQRFPEFRIDLLQC